MGSLNSHWNVLATTTKLSLPGSAGTLRPVMRLPQLKLRVGALGPILLPARLDSAVTLGASTL
jgi:hypothetical protein